MLDEFRSTSITWDKATRRIYSPVTANESDSNGRKLNIQVVNSGQVENLTGATLHLYWETKDKAQHGLDAFTASDITKGEFEIFYTTGMLSNVGELNATLVLVDGTGKVISDWFKITVARGINESAIESENSFTTLTQALIDISDLEQNYAPRLNDLTAQLQQTEQELSSQLAQTDDDLIGRDLNVTRFGVSIDSLLDQSDLIQQILDSNPNRKVILPKGRFVIKKTISIKNFRSLEFSLGAVVVIDGDIDGFVLSGTNAKIINPNIETAIGYTHSAITITAATGHVWNQEVVNPLLKGVGSTGYGIKILTHTTYGIMSPKILDYQISGYESSLLFDGNIGWSSGGLVKNGWSDEVVNSVEFKNNNRPSRWIFDNVKGQYKSSLTEYHFKNIQGTLNHLKDCLMWDGGIINIGESSVGTILSGHMITTVQDFGYRSIIPEVISATSTDNKYTVLKDSFIGNTLSNIWGVTKIGTGDLKTSFVSSTPQGGAAELSTGTAVNSIAQLDFGNKNQLSIYSYRVISFKFRIADLTDVAIEMGFKTDSDFRYSKLKNVGENLLFENKTSADTPVDVSAGAISKTAWNDVQIIINRSASTTLHVNKKLIGTFPQALPYGCEPYFKIENLVESDKKMYVADFFLRVEDRS